MNRDDYDSLWNTYFGQMEAARFRPAHAQDSRALSLTFHGGAAGTRVRVNGITDCTLSRDLGTPWWNPTHCDLTHLLEGRPRP